MTSAGVAWQTACPHGNHLENMLTRAFIIAYPDLRLARHHRAIGEPPAAYFFGAFANRRYGSLMSIAPNFSVACASLRLIATITS